MNCGKVAQSKLIKHKLSKSYITKQLPWIIITIGIILQTRQYLFNRSLRFSDKLIPAWTQLKIWAIRTAKYLHSDATGVKRKLHGSGKIINQHVHFVGHKFLSVFKITKRYNSAVILIFYFINTHRLIIVFELLFVTLSSLGLTRCLPHCLTVAKI